MAGPVHRATAQKGMLEGGVHLGAALTRLYQQSNTQNDFYFRPVPDIGIQISYGISRRFTLEAEMNYMPVSTRREGFLPLGNAFPDKNLPENSHAYFADQVDLDYLELPVLISGHMGGKLKLYCGLGPFIAIRLNAKRTTTGSSAIYSDSISGSPELPPPLSTLLLDTKRDITNDIAPVNFGGCERISLCYELGKSKFWAEARYTFGQTNVWKNDQGMGSNKTDQLLLRLAYTIQL